MNGKFSLVLEGHAALDEKMERFHKEAKEDHHLAMSLIRHSHDELKKEIQAVDKLSEARDTELQSTLTAEVQEIDKRSEARDAELQAILTVEIQGVRTKLSGKVEAVGAKVEGHENRIRFLERKAA